MSKLVQDILNTDYGDWNLDGLVDLANFNKSLRGDGSGSWASGDGNKDGINDLTDFNMWLTTLPSTVSSAPAEATVFEADAVTPAHHPPKPIVTSQDGPHRWPRLGGRDE